MGERRKPRFPRQREQRSMQWIKKQLIRRDGMMCGLCQEPIDSIKDATLDHIMPKSRGGTDTITNLRLAHKACNQERGAGFFADKGHSLWNPPPASEWKRPWPERESLVDPTVTPEQIREAMNALDDDPRYKAFTAKPTVEFMNTIFGSTADKEPKQ